MAKYAVYVKTGLPPEGRVFIEAPTAGEAIVRVETRIRNGLLTNSDENIIYDTLDPMTAWMARPLREEEEAEQYPMVDE